MEHKPIVELIMEKSVEVVWFLLRQASIFLSVCFCASILVFALVAIFELKFGQIFLSFVGLPLTFPFAVIITAKPYAVSIIIIKLLRLESLWAYLIMGLACVSPVFWGGFPHDICAINKFHLSFFISSICCGALYWYLDIKRPKQRLVAYAE
ncbi:MAG: hypothetical protein AB7F82_01970 [Alphaproteobacteria bacterium]